MKVVAGKPPNYLKIAEKFRLPEGVVFTYGDTVYTKEGYLSDDITIHEAVHVRQQLDIGADVWWELYLSNPQFRLKQEIPAYQAQYAYILKTRGRKERRETLDYLAGALSGPMYGSLLSRKEARKLIESAAGTPKR